MCLPKYFRAAAASVILLMCAQFAAADINSFLETITEIGETEVPEEDEAETSPPPPRRRDGQNHNQNSKTCGCLSDGCVQVTSQLASFWLLRSLSVHFGNFPYAELVNENNGTYIQYNEEMKMERREKFFRFSASAGGIYMDGIGAGFDFSFKGYFFKLFGPYLETWGMFNVSSLTEDSGGNVSSLFSLGGSPMLGGVRLGGQISLFQADVLSASVYVQYLMWYGAAEVAGGTFGIEFESFPIKPLALHLRLGGQTLLKKSSDFSASWISDVSLNEAELQAGIMIDRWEIYAGTRIWTKFNDETKEYDFVWGGVTAGARFYF